VTTTRGRRRHRHLEERRWHADAGVHRRHRCRPRHDTVHQHVADQAARLAVGAAADIIVVYVTFPDLAVSADPQRYTRLAESTYRFESLDGGFVRDIEVDEHGLVVTYPGLFRREV
jgi:hypothetical protein